MSVRNERAAKLPAKLSRSWLLAAPTSDDVLVEAQASEADSVIFDVEDGLPTELKDEGRARVVEALQPDAGSQSAMSAWVRVNPAETDLWREDLLALQNLSGLRGVVLAKTEHPDHVAYTGQLLGPGTPVIALIESGLGVENAPQIAKAPGTFRLAFGTGDFRRDTGVGDTALALAYARSKLVNASRVGELPGPVDGPAVTDDSSVLRESCRVTAEMGMTGKLTTRISQVEVINELLAPSVSEIAWARELLDADASGAPVTRDGSYLPRLRRAKKISRLAGSFGLWNR